MLITALEKREMEEVEERGRGGERKAKEQCWLQLNIFLKRTRAIPSRNYNGLWLKPMRKYLKVLLKIKY